MPVSEVSLSQFESHLWELANALRVSIDETRAKDGNLSIPLHFTVTQPTSASDAAAGAANPGLPAALESWLASSAACRASLAKILQPDLGA
jgi:hypothetical protein